MSNANDNPFEAFAVMLEDLVKELDSKMPDAVSMAIMVETAAMHKQRIFGEGLNTEGQKIGEYSNKEGYYSKEMFIRKAAFKPQGKKSKRVGAKSMFLPGGYKEFRDIQGRQTAFVDLKFSGSAERGLNVVKIGQPVYYGVTDQKESLKFEGLTDKYGDFLSLSNEEKSYITDELTEAAKQIADTHGKP